MLKKQLISCFVLFSSTSAIEVTKWSDLGIELVQRPPDILYEEITLKENTTINLVTSNAPVLGSQIFGGQVEMYDWESRNNYDLTINVKIDGKEKDGSTSIYRFNPSHKKPFPYFSFRTESTSTKLIVNVDATKTPVKNLFDLGKTTLNITPITYINFTPKSKIDTVFLVKDAVLEFRNAFVLDLRESEAVNGKKLAFDNANVLNINPESLAVPVQIYGDFRNVTQTPGGRIFANLATPESIIEGKLEIDALEDQFAFNNTFNLSAQSKMNLDVVFFNPQSTNKKTFFASLKEKSTAKLNIDFQSSQNSQVELSANDSMLYANFFYQESETEKLPNSQKITLNQNATWITTTPEVLVSEIVFNPSKSSLTGSAVDLRFSDFEGTLRTHTQLDQSSRLILKSQNISGNGGYFRIYGVLNRDFWSKDALGNTIATDQIITTNLSGNHYIQIFWNPENLDNALLNSDLTGDRIVVAQQLSTQEQGNFIGAKTPLGILEYTTPLQKEDLLDETGQKIGYEWIVGKIDGDPKPSFLARTLNALFNSPYQLFVTQTQTLHQRMGDLRYLDSVAGTYLKLNYGLILSQENQESIASSSMATNILLGGDYDFYSPAGKHFLGVSFNVTPFEDFGGVGYRSDIYRGSSIAYGISLYQTTLFNSGVYLDTLVKYFFANQAYTLYSQELAGNQFRFNTHSLLTSLELGYKMRLPIQTPSFDYSFYYLKPQFNFLIGTLFGNKPIELWHASGYALQAQSVYAIPIRPEIALDLGRRFDSEKILGDVFVTLGAEYTFNAGHTLLVKTPYNEGRFAQEDVFNLKLGVGGNVMFFNGIRFYFEANSRFLGRVAPVLDLHAGIRVPLGGRHIRASEMPSNAPLRFSF